MPFLRNDGRSRGRGRRNEFNPNMINFRQKEKDILDSILGVYFGHFLDWDHKHFQTHILGSKHDGVHSYDARIRPATVDAITNVTGECVSGKTSVYF